MNNNFLLFYTGDTRDASGTLADQVTRTEQGDDEMLANLDRTKEIGRESLALLESGDLDRYAELMHEHWENKRKRSPGMTNERIDELYTLARRSGVIGGKLVGAGGGGFLLVYTCRPDETRTAMTGAGARELRFGIDTRGCVAGRPPG
jgi:D-glycero-alpha-D-manno-heptose-7-phosphate kinase